jgi:hypothetical protein
MDDGAGLRRGEGSSVGSDDGTEDGKGDGIDDGHGEGKGVGLQSILSCGSKHLSGQHPQLIPIGRGKTLHIMLPTDAQLAGVSLGSVSQHAVGHSSIK